MSIGKTLRTIACICVLALAVSAALPLFAQMPEAREKPPVYSYVGFWAIPRAQWGAMQKSYVADQAVLDRAMASGTIVAYGNDINLVHTPDGYTHDDWWSATSMAGLLNVLDQFYRSGSSNTPVLASATKHWDAIIVSRFYNWRPGTYKDVYTHGASYKLKADAPEEAVERLSRSMLVPLLEKLLADGTIFEYDIDVDAIHTDSPGTFYIFYSTERAEGIDKVNAAVHEALRSHPLDGAAFMSMTDFTAHRDYLSRTNASYK